VYLEQAALDPTFHIIDCGCDGKILPAETIFDKIKYTINTLITL
jgi:hypothetical protein